MDKLDKFLEWMDDKNLHFCFCWEMEEKYCQFYKNEVEDCRGGFCTARDKEDCRVRYHTLEDCVPYDKAWYELWKAKEAMKKQIEFEKQYHKIVEWL